MRQRRLIDLDERMEDLADYLDLDGTRNKGRWQEVFAPRRGLFLEIGCGKGKFICEKAQAEPDCTFIGIEGQESVIVRAAEKVRSGEIPNVYLISNYVRNLEDFFGEGELDGIYLNFSDPWPKARHAKRRLTYRDNLAGYMKVIKEGGFIEFKTDNDGLFEFTLEEIEHLGYNVEEMTRDLHSSGYTAGQVRTEYEEKFIAKGKNINYLKVVKV